MNRWITGVRSPPSSIRQNATLGRGSCPVVSKLSPVSPTHSVFASRSQASSSGSRDGVGNPIWSITWQDWSSRNTPTRSPNSVPSLTTAYPSSSATRPESSTSRGSLIAHTCSPGTDSAGTAPPVGVGLGWAITAATAATAVNRSRN
jgi:hypothetical protein